MYLECSVEVPVGTGSIEPSFYYSNLSTVTTELLKKEFCFVKFVVSFCINKSINYLAIWLETVFKKKMKH